MAFDIDKFFPVFKECHENAGHYSGEDTYYNMKNDTARSAEKNLIFVQL